MTGRGHITKLQWQPNAGGRSETECDVGRGCSGSTRGSRTSGDNSRAEGAETALEVKGARLSKIGYRAREGVFLAVACDPEWCGFLQQAVSMKLLFSSSCKS